MVNIGLTSTGGRVMPTKASPDLFLLAFDSRITLRGLVKTLLTNPASTEFGEKVALSRQMTKLAQRPVLISSTNDCSLALESCKRGKCASRYDDRSRLINLIQ